MNRFLLYQTQFLVFLNRFFVRESIFNHKMPKTLIITILEVASQTICYRHQQYEGRMKVNSLESIYTLTSTRATSNKFVPGTAKVFISS
jgi:hypothetical protein